MSHNKAIKQDLCVNQTENSDWHQLPDPFHGQNYFFFFSFLKSSSLSIRKRESRWIQYNFVLFCFVIYSTL
ncbi:Uncharacterized protein APZ42_017003 [Daphnia magna]|uniref:Uncharacterized protein n=1 Tax=Daphnia magna TaxID=35525 RepID=A0A165AA87_9CRUS|nr:Uncharacterized protein APZ42_017003 [Daphnia magna]